MASPTARTSSDTTVTPFETVAPLGLDAAPSLDAPLAADQQRLESLIADIQKLKKKMVLIQREFSNTSVGDLVECLRMVQNDLGTKIATKAQPTDDEEILRNVKALSGDIATLAIRVNNLSLQRLLTPAEFVQVGSFSQYSPQIPRGTIAPPTAKNACAGTSGAALERFMQMTPEAFDALIRDRDPKAFSRLIDTICLEGIGLHKRMLADQQLEQAIILSQRDPSHHEDEAFATEHVSFTSNLAESNLFNHITRLGQSSTLAIESHAPTFFKREVQHLVDIGAGPRGFPIGAAITCRGNIYALAILSPNKIIFFDSHGSTETVLSTNKAFVIAFESVDAAANFLADRMPFERPDHSQVDTSLPGVEGIIAAIHDRNTVGICPVKLRNSISPPLDASALAARVTSAQPSVIRPTAPVPDHRRDFFHKDDKKGDDDLSEWEDMGSFPDLSRSQRDYDAKGSDRRPPPLDLRGINLGDTQYGGLDHKESEDAADAEVASIHAASGRFPPPPGPRRGSPHNDGDVSPDTLMQIAMLNSLERN